MASHDLSLELDNPYCDVCHTVGSRVGVRCSECATMERDAKAADRKTVEKALAKARRLMQRSSLDLSNAQDDLAAANRLIVSLQLALQAAETNLARLTEARNQRREMFDMAEEQHNVLQQLSRSVASRQVDAENAPEDGLQRELGGVHEDGVEVKQDVDEEKGEESLHFDNYMYGGHESPNNPDALGVTKQEEEYREWLRLQEENVQRPPGARQQTEEWTRELEEERARLSRVRQWAAAVQTPTPAVSVKQEEDDGEEQILPGVMTPRAVKSEEHSIKREQTADELLSLPAIKPDPEPAGTSGSGRSRPVAVTAAAGRPQRTTRQTHRTQPYSR